MERLAVNNVVKYQEELRNAGIDREGLYIAIRQPLEENKQNLYGDLKSSYKDIERIKCIPQYDNYFELLGLFGNSVEDTLPLHVLLKSDQHIKRDSIFELPRPQALDSSCPKEQQWTYWRVLGEEVKHLGRIYGKFAKCVPARNFTWQEFNTAMVTENNILIQTNEGQTILAQGEQQEDLTYDSLYDFSNYEKEMK